MGISLITYAGSTVTSQDDALVYEAALRQSGMLYGAEVTLGSANVLHVAAGHGVLCGRKFTIEATDIAVPLTATGTLNGRLYIHMDLSDVDEPISILTQTAETISDEIQQTNVNINSGIYEIRMATFTVDTSTIDNLNVVTPYISGGTAVSNVTGASGTSDGQVKISVNKGDTTTNTDMSVTGWNKLVGQWTNVVSCVLGATSASFTNPFNTTSVAVEAYIENSSGSTVGYNTMTTTASTITLAFDELEEAADIKLLVKDLS